MSDKSQKIMVALAGQPNSGKSTIFNILTGARQHVANYPGVTVEKKTGSFRLQDDRVELVDLPGTHSLTSYTLEERIARDFLLNDKPAAVVDVLDASNLERNLYLTFQLAEMDISLVIDLNMIDVAEKRGIKIDTQKLSQELGAPVISTVGNKGKGKRRLKEAILSASKKRQAAHFRINYGDDLEPILDSLEKRLSEEMEISSRYPVRWLTVKLMENDEEAQKLVRKYSQKSGVILKLAEEKREAFKLEHKKSPQKVIAITRHQEAERIVEASVTRSKEITRTLTDRIDEVACSRYFGPVVLVATIYLIYELAIVQGYKITEYTWPLLAWSRDLIASLLPSEGFIFDPFFRSMPIWVVDGTIAVLNYVPIFLILFALIAILEDTGYMARMAFILDRIFRHFGLHGQSVLPMVIGGLYVGGCAIPGVLACRGMKDEKARLATILIVPLMNCLAKIPFYVLLIGMFFAAYKGIAMFFIATITIIIALSVAKLLNLTVLRKRLRAPFVMEMPPYHIPTTGGVLRRCLERTWLFVKKIITIVILVSVIVYALIYFPGISEERKAHFISQAEQAQKIFFKKTGKDNPYAGFMAGDNLMDFTRYWRDYKKAKMGAKGKKAKQAVEQGFREKNLEFFKIVKRGKYKVKGEMIKDKHAKKVYTAYKKLGKTTNKLRREIKEETIITSYMGRAGLFLEPLTRWAGFNWRVNIALMSSFAAKESSVATLGGIYQSPPGEKHRLEDRMKEKEKGWTALHVLAIMLFMAMYPPCIPTLLMIKVETGSIKWMLFATFYPIVLGSIIAVFIFTGGNLLGLSGMQAMFAFYILALIVLVLMGLIKREQEFA
ncbi:MAG: ferrous iron transport protein B [Desulfobacteraceae bacterium Eth-SRB1]|nr:MAG: ferrous iron transport protein B [Desulfobacteraceae bacterium Eth-SRB1]